MIGIRSGIALLTLCIVCVCMGDTHLMGVSRSDHERHQLEPETNMYQIMEQKQGRGENAEMVLIKRVSKGVSTDAKGKISGMFPLKSVSGKPLPCLKVILSDGSEDHSFSVRWSNYNEQVDLSPGTFRLVRTDIGTPLMIYIKDAVSNRVLNDRSGRKMIDYVEMAQRYDSHFDPKNGWTYGENQARVETTEEMFATDDIDRANELLEARFGPDLANDVMSLFVDHDLFRSFMPAELMTA